MFYFEVSLQYKLQNGIIINTKEYYDTLYDVADQFNIKIETLQGYYISLQKERIPLSPITSIKVVDNKPPVKVVISDYE